MSQALTDGEGVPLNERGPYSTKGGSTQENIPFLIRNNRNLCTGSSGGVDINGK